METFIRHLRLYDLKSVSDMSGVHVTTLYNWLRGKNTPNMAKLLKVAPVIGLELVMVNNRARMIRVA
jgi:transcriptional regulator with XRE-family HTH domain